MRLRDAGAVLLLIATALPACSRLTFVKPDYSKTEYKQTQEPVPVHDSAAVKRRIAARERLALAASRLQSGDLDAAEREAHAVLKQDPHSAEANTVLAVVEGRRGRSAQAGAYYKRAAELAPTRGAELNNYGVWLCGNGQAAESLAWFDRAIAAPGYAQSASALVNAGACAQQAGQVARAERDLRRAMELDPNNAVALGALAELAYARGDYFEARAFSERRLAAAPANAPSLLLASQIENKLGDRTAADRYVRRLRQEFPNAGAANAVETRRP
jgi:type IV pilus assembly protein PilF